MKTRNSSKASGRGAVTKQDLNDLETRNKNELQHAVSDFKETVLSFKDEILHEIKAMREELAIITGYKDQIEDHEVRIETIEKRLQIPQ